MSIGRPEPPTRPTPLWRRLRAWLNGWPWAMTKEEDVPIKDRSQDPERKE